MLKVPSVISWAKFESIGFYDFIALQACIAKAMSKNIHLSESLPPDLPTRASLVGIFHHKIMELVVTSGTERELLDSIEIEIQQLQEIVSSSPHLKRSGSVSGWDEVNASATLAIAAFYESSVSAKESARTWIEKTLYSSDKQLVGRPDFFTIDGKNATLREFKSGSIRDTNGQIKVEYLEQIKFYSLLLFDTLGIESVNAILESVRGDSYRCTIKNQDIEQLRRRILSVLAEANSQIVGSSEFGNLTRTSAEACTNCNKKIVCGAFKRDQASMVLPSGVSIFAGQVSLITSKVEERIVDVLFQEEITQSQYLIQIPAELAQDIEVGKSYVISDIARKGETIRWTERSRVFLSD